MLKVGGETPSEYHNYPKVVCSCGAVFNSRKHVLCGRCRKVVNKRSVVCECGLLFITRSKTKVVCNKCYKSNYGRKYKQDRLSHNKNRLPIGRYIDGGGYMVTCNCGEIFRVKYRDIKKCNKCTRREIRRRHYIKCWDKCNARVKAWIKGLPKDHPSYIKSREYKRIWANNKYPEKRNEILRRYKIRNQLLPDYLVRNRLVYQMGISPECITDEMIDAKRQVILINRVVLAIRKEIGDGKI